MICRCHAVTWLAARGCCILMWRTAGGATELDGCWGWSGVGEASAGSEIGCMGGDGEAEAVKKGSDSD